ncbi:hypothetical protein WISP_40044 [Willisornis vidua]|uniref:Uncharacterized protein n=1 Tax=Willisornis vidua TaxID=1566151 RepID=A0ABQ9DH48_9PASS|nr:hypothetical protein WISP_40044 [Willisornis vidua]
MSAGSGAAAGTATSALCLLLSLTAVAVCLLLGAKTAELQGRLAALEERGAAGHGPLLDALQPRVEQLFREKLGEGLAKLRTAREAPSDCLCPPGSAELERELGSEMSDSAGPSPIGANHEFLDGRDDDDVWLHQKGFFDASLAALKLIISIYSRSVILEMVLKENGLLWELSSPVLPGWTKEQGNGDTLEKLL